MARIPLHGLRHVRKTITFTGAANLGALDDEVTVMPCTGVVLVERIVYRVTTALVCSAASTVLFRARFGTQTDWGNSLSGIQTVGTVMASTAYGSVSGVGALAGSGGFAQSIAAADMNFLPQDDGGGANITAGTIVVDCWYYPITDDGALAGDDIDGAIDGYSLEEAMRLVLSALAGKLSGAATTSIAIRDVADTTNRIAATVDSSGNRTAITLDAD